MPRYHKVGRKEKPMPKWDSREQSKRLTEYLRQKGESDGRYVYGYKNKKKPKEVCDEYDDDTSQT